MIFISKKKAKLKQRLSIASSMNVESNIVNAMLTKRGIDPSKATLNQFMLEEALIKLKKAEMLIYANKNYPISNNLQGDERSMFENK